MVPFISENVKVAKASQTTDYQKSIQVIFGTVFGVFGFLGILIVGTLLYRFCKNRRTSRSGKTLALDKVLFFMEK